MRYLLALLLAICASLATAQDVQAALDDLRLATAVRLVLATDPATRATAARVQARAGAVAVDGSWPTTASAARAAELARAVPGVATVAMGDGPPLPARPLGAGAAAEPDEPTPALAEPEAGQTVEDVEPREPEVEVPPRPQEEREVEPAPPAPVRRPRVAPPADAPADRQPLTHTVRVGDTLYSIARRYSTTVEDLQRLNGLGESTAITLGRRLRVEE